MFLLLLSPVAVQSGGVISSVAGNRHHLASPVRADPTVA
jgi:hypothetical protein